MRLFPMAALGAAVALTISAPAAQAGPASDVLGQCLVAQTTGAERVMMIRWVTFAFAAHPQLGSAVTVDKGLVESTDREMAALFTALLADRCRAETEAAFDAEGQLAFQQAFMVLGQVASQELALAPEVNAAMSGFLNFLDNAKLEPLFQ